MYQKFMKQLEKPPLYRKTMIPFWDDEYISGQMLKAHLDPDYEGASRKLEFIGRSVSWIKETVPPKDYGRLLDLGCGPGIYAERFARAGFQVTGVDFSRRSVSYAKESSVREGLDIRYFYDNYLNLDLGEEFDFSTMIYCDYGALATEDRKTVMETVYRHLKPGGKFLLDVFSTVKYDNFQEGQTWELCRDGGFWSGGEYVALNGNYKYPGSVTLEQISVVTEKGVSTYYLWNTCFTKAELIQEAGNAGFKVCGIFGDVAGNDYHENNLTIAILLEKQEARMGQEK